jgi:hypothetical protein
VLGGLTANAADKQADRTAIDTAVTITFTTTGPHCVVLGAQDDLGRNVGQLTVVEVAP